MGTAYNIQDIQNPAAHPLPFVNGVLTIDNASDITQVEVFTFVGIKNSIVAEFRSIHIFKRFGKPR